MTLVAVHLQGKINEAADALSCFFRPGSQCSKGTISGTPGVAQDDIASQTRPPWTGVVCTLLYFQKVLPGNTRYVTFCMKESISPLLLCKRHFCSFVAYLANKGLKFRIMKACLSVAQHMQIVAAMLDPLKEH